MSISCPNCKSYNISHVRDVYVLNDVKTQLVYCENCDFLYLDNPSWLTRAYRQEFFGDTGYVQRNLRQAYFMKLLIKSYELFTKNEQEIKACDLGTGLGLFPRLMRDYGYNFWGSDEYSDMQLIKPYVNPSFKPQVCTAFEVVEHIPCLPNFLRHNIQESSIFVFSTLLRKNGEIPSDDWWYYAFKLGQHISFHSRQSIAYALNRVDVSSHCLKSVDQSLHAIVLNSRWEKPFFVAATLYEKPIFRPLSYILNRVYSKPSLIWSDHLEAMNLLT